MLGGKCKGTRRELSILEISGELPFRDAINPSARLHHACCSVAITTAARTNPWKGSGCPSSNRTMHLPNYFSISTNQKPTISKHADSSDSINVKPYGQQAAARPLFVYLGNPSLVLRQGCAAMAR
ncbi:unnamed protein product [Pleuronectes platessa]|uniref:Uncharacterized protein n=1 Tax=Pleuronectes platessa TaxID=8262 RepID=A0A9N7V7U0_PLEPL|nr:unnamed protein product [Pleuronectes platessa]